jgi:hypothetical protein
VWLVKASPVVAAGSGFAPGKRVTVAYRAGLVRRHVVALVSARGTFRATFAGMAFKRCAGAAVTAGAAELVVQPCTAPGSRPSLSAGRLGFVRGSSFVPREQVVVTGRLSGEAPSRQLVTAGSDGSFSLQVPLHTRACAETFFLAQGSLGSRATATLVAPACKPA